MKAQIIFFLLIINSIYSQNSNLKITNLKPDKEENIFPEIKYTKKPNVEEKINTFLQLDYLEHLPNKFIKNPFEKITHADYVSGNTSLYDWKINKNSENILSLTISGESTGAYSEEFDNYENFDLRNGNIILLSNIFTPNGLSEITKKLNLAVKKRITNFLKEIKSVKNEKILKENEETFSEQLELYEACLQDMQSNSIEYYQFYFTKMGITFVRGRCSNHAMRAIDDLDRHYINFSNTSIDKYLTIYGKNLINDKSENSNTKSPEGKIFKGKINNKYPITAIITEIYDDGSIQMKYWYDKVKDPIEWNGKFNNNHFSLNESIYNETNQESTTTATIEANFVGYKKIIGTWTNEKTKDVLKLELEEY